MARKGRRKGGGDGAVNEATLVNVGKVLEDFRSSGAEGTVLTVFLICFLFPPFFSASWFCIISFDVHFLALCMIWHNCIRLLSQNLY
jgi:hypothetical protein